MTTPTQTVQWTAACPDCAEPCVWQSTGTDRVGTVPQYRIFCDCRPVVSPNWTVPKASWQ